MPVTARSILPAHPAAVPRSRCEFHLTTGYVMATRILLADDHPVVRLGLRDLLAEQFVGAVIGEARTIPELLERVQADAWDILVLDLSIPGAQGLDAFRALKQIRPTLPVLVLTIHPEDQF